MKWSKELPTKSGWYWRASSVEWCMYQATVCEVEISEDGFLVWYGESLCSMEDPSPGDLWAGPIPEPSF